MELWPMWCQPRVYHPADTGHGTQPRHSIQTRCRPVVVLSIDVRSHHYISFMKVLHNADSVRSCIIILENETWIHYNNTKKRLPLVMMRWSRKCIAKRDGPPQLVISFLSFFFAHPYLFKLICGSDMDMIPNNFCVFLWPNTSNFTRHKFLDLFFHLFFKDNEINVNIPNFCPPVYNWGNKLLTELYRGAFWRSGRWPTLTLGRTRLQPRIYVGSTLVKDGGLSKQMILKWNGRE